MHWQPFADQNSRIARADMLRTIREFFYQRNVLEVETSAISVAANTDPYIESFVVDTGFQPRYLHTSPEFAMKRLLADGSGDIYQICKVWRNEPSASHHNAEFTMLEYYRLGYTLQDLMNEVNSLLKQVIPSLSNDSHFHSYEQLFLDNLGINPHTIAEAALQQCVKVQVPEFQGELDRQSALDLLLTHCIEPTLPKDRLSFIFDYPSTQSALAITQSLEGYDGIRIAKRFEVYVGELELGNGYQELTTATENTAVIMKEMEQRRSMQQRCAPYDQYFLQAMESGLPDCAGIAIGLDRLLMLATGAKTLQEVLNFSWENA